MKNEATATYALVLDPVGKDYDQDASQNLANSFHCENGETEVVEFRALHFVFKGLVDDDGDGVEDEGRSHACECEASRHLQWFPNEVCICLSFLFFRFTQLFGLRQVLWIWIPNKEEQQRNQQESYLHHQHIVELAEWLNQEGRQDVARHK